MEEYEQTLPILLITATSEAEIQEIAKVVSAKLHFIHPGQLGALEHNVEEGQLPLYGYVRANGEHMSTSEQEIEERFLTEILCDVDLVVYVVSYPERELTADLTLLCAIRNRAPEKPILILGSIASHAANIFDATTGQPLEGVQEEANAAYEWLEYLQQTLSPKDVHSVFAYALEEGEKVPAAARRKLSKAVEAVLPKEKRVAWLAFEQTDPETYEKGKRMILGASATAGCVGLMPFPLVDLPCICATQVALIMSLFSLYGRAFSKDMARSLVLAAISVVAGPLAFHTITKFLPGFGSLVGCGIAGSLTYLIGHVLLEMLEKGEEITLAGFKAAVKKRRKEEERKKRSVQREQ